MLAVTIKDVANLAGVSPATVSRVINNSSLVKEETAEKVNEAIDKLNYQINESARVLRTNCSSLIGVIGAGMDNPFLMKLLKGVEASAKAHGFNLIFGDSEGELEQELKYLNILNQRRVDGLIIITASIYNNLLDEIKSKGIPAVFASGYVNDNEIPCISVNNTRAAEDVIDYLYDLGHRKFGIIRGTYSDLVTSGERIKGVKSSFQKHQIDFNSVPIYEGDFSFESGSVAAKKILSDNPETTAIFCFDDKMAIGAIRGAEELGYNIPEDLSIVGFDDIELSSYVKPALTTIHQSGYDMGYQAMEFLNKIIDGEDPGKLKEFLPHELKIRESSGTPPT
ncbi:LacI family DNA-binding transcriptional regulator [Halonatronomonas betaini]|uniref:LacI family DNA-binding transcriptional regulator n=1 Tax=Halonatronomonas betaini TaxID=2778430 RepID=UPI0022E895D2|nr:LacI family DNA-binding transcriptional regulator [Halonatronomonas betaini]